MASGVGDTAAWFLAITFAIAAITKLRSPLETEASFQAFGLRSPESLARAVPVAELVTSVGLVAAPRFASLVALSLLVVFTAVLIRGLRSGVSIGCGCFGSTGRKAVSEVEAARNGVLITLAMTTALTSKRGVASPSLAGVIAIGGGFCAISGLIALARSRKGDQNSGTQNRPTSIEGPL